MRSVPFSVFPSAYKNEQQETVEVKTEEQVTVQDAGREGQRPQKATSRQDNRYTREDIRITEEDRRRPQGRVRREEEIRVYEEDRYNDRRDTRETRFETERQQ